MKSKFFYCLKPSLFIFLFLFSRAGTWRNSVFLVISLNYLLAIKKINLFPSDFSVLTAQKL